MKVNEIDQLANIKAFLKKNGLRYYKFKEQSDLVYISRSMAVDRHV